MGLAWIRQQSRIVYPNRGFVLIAPQRELLRYKIEQECLELYSKTWVRRIRWPIICPRRFEIILNTWRLVRTASTWTVFADRSKSHHFTSMGFFIANFDAGHVRRTMRISMVLSTLSLPQVGMGRRLNCALNAASPLWTVK